MNGNHVMHLNPATWNGIWLDMYIIIETTLILFDMVHPKLYGKKDTMVALFNYMDLLYNYCNNGIKYH